MNVTEHELNNWWWETNGSGTGACPSANCINGKSICSWHSARLDDLMSLFTEETDKRIAVVIGEDKPEYSFDYLTVGGETFSKQKVNEMIKVENSLRAEQRKRLASLKEQLTDKNVGNHDPKVRPSMKDQFTKWFDQCKGALFVGILTREDKEAPAPTQRNKE